MEACRDQQIVIGSSSRILTSGKTRYEFIDDVFDDNGHIPTMGPVISSTNVHRLVVIQMRSTGTATSWATYHATVPNRKTGAESNVRIVVTRDIPGGWVSIFNLILLCVDLSQRCPEPVSHYEKSQICVAHGCASQINEKGVCGG